MDLWEQVWWRATEVIRWLEHFSYGNMLTVVIVPPGGSGRTCSGLAIPKGGLTKKKKKKKRMERDSLLGSVVIGQGGMALN